MVPGVVWRRRLRGFFGLENLVLQGEAPPKRAHELVTFGHTRGGAWGVRKLRVNARTHLQQARHTARDGLGDAPEDRLQGALGRPVTADQPQALLPPQLEAHILHRPELVRPQLHNGAALRQSAPPAMTANNRSRCPGPVGKVLQARSRWPLEAGAEPFAHVVDFDQYVVAHLRRIGVWRGWAWRLIEESGWVGGQLSDQPRSDGRCAPPGSPVRCTAIRRPRGSGSYWTQ